MIGGSRGGHDNKKEHEIEERRLKMRTRKGSLKNEPTKESVPAHLALRMNFQPKTLDSNEGFNAALSHEWLSFLEFCTLHGVVSSPNEFFGNPVSWLIHLQLLLLKSPIPGQKA